MISIIVSITCFIIIGMSFLANKRVQIYLRTVLIWWSVWLIMSTFSLGGIDLPEWNTYAVFIVYLTSILFGSFLIQNPKLKTGISVDHLQKNKYNYLGLEAIIVKILLILVAPAVLFFFLRSLDVMVSVGDVALYRSLAFSSDALGSSVIFVTNQIEFLYEFFIKTVLYACFFVSLSIYKNHGRIKLLLLCAILFAMNSVMMLGRFDIYYFLLFYLLAELYRGGLKAFFKATLKNIRLYALSAVFVLIAGAISMSRAATKNVKELLLSYVVNYHTFSFAAFDRELNDNYSLLNNMITFGAASLGSLVTLATLIARKFGYEDSALASIIGSYLNDSIIVGTDAYGNEVIGNAFYSIIYNLYIDGRIFGVIIFGILFGYALAYYSRRNDNIIRGDAALFFLLYVGLGGLFMPLLSGNIIPIYIAVLFLSRKKLGR